MVVISHVFSKDELMLLVATIIEQSSGRPELPKLESAFVQLQSLTEPQIQEACTACRANEDQLQEELKSIHDALKVVLQQQHELSDGKGLLPLVLMDIVQTELLYWLQLPELPKKEKDTLQEALHVFSSLQKGLSKSMRVERVIGGVSCVSQEPKIESSSSVKAPVLTLMRS